MRGIWVALMAAAVVSVAAGWVGRSPNVHVVAFSPARQVLRIRRASSGAGGDFAAMVRAARPAVAFNGTYYGTDGKPLGLLRSEGKWVFRNGHMRTVFVVDGAGRAAIVSRSDVRKNPKRYPFALAAGPRLLTNGKVTLNPEAEGFRPASRTLRAPRVGMGVSKDGAGVVVVQDEFVTLAEFAATCREAGAMDAVNLDGGGVAALYEDGRVVVAPRKPMSNIVTISPR
jgi:uncharacterized protein YigE (DUF2233 family)